MHIKSEHPIEFLDSSNTKFMANNIKINQSKPKVIYRQI